ncbi:DUF6602 domain-containing protein [Paenibacillus sp. y28]|uniref:DUF6602 domain-containing protein n=1 Tax=Paenibacillus sp. y28 TaxID=3129110 RepID=UPI00301A3284
MSKEEPDHGKVLKKIVQNYNLLEQTIVDQLQFSVAHHLTTGIYREGIWKSLFEQIVPKKFSIEQSVFIVDSQGNVSKEVDLVIFDEQYTPYIFRYGNIKYIPIEAVAVVVQCKSTNVNGDELQKWAVSIDRLKTSLMSVVRTQGSLACGLDEITKPSTQTSTRPIKILCHTDKKTSEQVQKLFDIILHPVGNKLTITIPNENERHLGQWHATLNHAGEDDPVNKQECLTVTSGKATEVTLDAYRVRQKEEPREERSLLSLTFQLNQLLMLINNPIFFPHLAYVEMFQKYIVEEKQQKGKSAGAKRRSSK